MTSIPAGIVAEQAITRQNIALSVIKQANEQQQALVRIIDDASRSAPVSGTRGSNISTSA